MRNLKRRSVYVTYANLNLHITVTSDLKLKALLREINLCDLGTVSFLNLKW